MQEKQEESEIMHLFSFLFRNFADNMQIFLAYVRILEEPSDTFHQMNNLKKKALFGWIADLTSIQYVFQRPNMRLVISGQLKRELRAT